jgi:hypothetical protein
VSYITPDGVVLDWSQVAFCFVLVLALSAFLTEGIEMISRRRDTPRGLLGKRSGWEKNSEPRDFRT